jgi:hypothetical protein
VWLVAKHLLRRTDVLAVPPEQGAGMHCGISFIGEK